MATAVHAKVGQPKSNNQNVMCHQPMKLSDMFDQNPPCTFDIIREKPSNKHAVHKK